MAEFTAQVDDFIARSEEYMTAVFKASAQDFVEDAQRPVSKGGRMPVDTSFLRNSHVSGLNGSTSLSGAESYVTTIANSELGDTIDGGWTAEYALRIEFGLTGADSLGRKYNQKPTFFARGAAQKWPDFVKENAAKLKGKLK